MRDAAAAGPTGYGYDGFRADTPTGGEPHCTGGEFFDFDLVRARF
jgi:hypothetical protein